MRPDERHGAEGAMWDALLTGLEEPDREHAQRRVWESIEEDRSRAGVWDEDAAAAGGQVYGDQVYGDGVYEDV